MHVFMDGDKDFPAGIFKEVLLLTLCFIHKICGFD